MREVEAAAGVKKGCKYRLSVPVPAVRLMRPSRCLTASGRTACLLQPILSSTVGVFNYRFSQCVTACLRCIPVANMLKWVA